MEKTFKLVIALAVVVFCLFTIGLFLLAVKIILAFTPELHMMGITFTG